MSRWSADYGNSRLKLKHSAPPEKHIMGKPEAKVMRRLMALTKLTQEEVREIKKYRKMLSDAQTNNGKNPSKKNLLNYLFIDGVLKKNNIDIDDPKTKQIVKEAFMNKTFYEFNCEPRDTQEYEYFYHMLKNTNVDVLIRRYKKYKKRFCC